MVDYIGTERLIGLVTRVGPAQFIAGLAADIEADFLRWGEFEKSARHATHSAVGVIELMPTCDGRLYSFKYVNGHPKNTAQGLLTVTAFGVLADVDTGYPLLLSEMTYATALRTAATSALAARALARPACRVMALIGNGAQSEFQAVAFHHMLGIRELRLYDTDLRATLKLERNLAMLGLPGLHIVRCSSTAQAVRGADIVTTVTADKCKAIILTPDMIAPGMHLNAIGGDCPGKTELHPDILRRADARVVVEFEAQSRIEGEVQQLPSSFPVTELSAVLSGKARRAHERARRDDLRFGGFCARGLLDTALPVPAAQRRARRASADRPGTRSGGSEESVRSAGCARRECARQGPPCRSSKRMSAPRRRTASLIGVPTDVGAADRGASMGPEALRVAGIQQALVSRGLTVVDRGNLSGPTNPWLSAVDGYRHLPEVVKWNQGVHDAVHAELKQDHLPIVLGGDHSLGIGSVSAVARYCRDSGKKLRVLWLDAHADFNTPKLSPSGNIHGMPVACLCGFGPPELGGDERRCARG